MQNVYLRQGNDPLTAVVDHGHFLPVDGNKFAIHTKVLRGF
jgi:hypothetical protein